LAGQVFRHSPGLIPKRSVDSLFGGGCAGDGFGKVPFIAYLNSAGPQPITLDDFLRYQAVLEVIVFSTSTEPSFEIDGLDAFLKRARPSGHPHFDGRRDIECHRIIFVIRTAISEMHCHVHRVLDKAHTAVCVLTSETDTLTVFDGHTHRDLSDQIQAVEIITFCFHLRFIFCENSSGPTVVLKPVSGAVTGLPNRHLRSSHWGEKGDDDDCGQKPAHTPPTSP
jgi:hypothetical protein